MKEKLTFDNREKGIGARRNQGYGKFVVEVVLTKEPKK